jgi:monoamine oxidase
MYGLENFLMNEPDYMRLYTIDGGIERLPQELARRLSARVLLRQPVARVERSGPAVYRVTSRRRGAVMSEEYDAVVAALPNNWLPAVEWGGPLLAEAMRKHHAHYDHPAHYLRVSALFERPFWREKVKGSYFMLDSFGGCCVYDEGSRADAGPYGVLGWLLAGEAAVTLGNLADDALIDHVLGSLPRCLGQGRELFLEGRVHRWLGTVNALPGGRPLHDPDARHRPEPTEHPMLFAVGDYLFDSTLNGALDSADVAVEWIVDEIKDRLALTNGHAAPAASANGAPAAPAPGALLPA